MLPDYDPEYVDYLFSGIVHDMSEKYIIEIFTKYFDCSTEQVEKAIKKGYEAERPLIFHDYIGSALLDASINDSQERAQNALNDDFKIWELMQLRENWFILGQNKKATLADGFYVRLESN